MAQGNKTAVGQSPTVAEVAAAAGVSTATVSRTINGSATVSQETANKVSQAMKKLGYVPNASARALRSQRTGTIGVILPGFDNLFYFELLPHIETECRKRGYSVLIAGGEDPTAECQRLANSRTVDGILIISSSWEPNKKPLTDKDINLPVLSFDRPIGHSNLPLVYTDNVAGAETICQHLIDCGATSILHIEGPEGSPVSEERKSGFLKACAQAELEDVQLASGDFTAESGAEAVEKRLDNLPEAIFAANDLMAIGALMACAKHDVSVPDEVLIAGFDGITTASLVQPSLTTLIQPIEEMARVAVEQIIQRVSSEGDAVPTTFRIPGTLRVGGSTTR
ncbi:LacI family DNA-binding transcriptional regulator [Corynebacterium sp.]|uniref:LacI family DNA-binding transcriptional regulator n=1 Tax=Corynebacterium sp. TaxID=1720 RepID=UPI00373643CA